jgi:hypothetical protein
VQSIFAKTTIAKLDSLRNDSLQVAQKMLAQQQQQLYLDSIIKAKLEIELENASGNRAKQNELTAKLAE